MLQNCEAVCNPCTGKLSERVIFTPFLQLALDSNFVMSVQSIYFYQEQYTHHVGAAVPGKNIEAFENKSALECKLLCSADKNCLAIEYATTRDAGSSPKYQSGTCITQSSNAYEDFSKKNNYKNLDVYVKTGNILDFYID